MKAGNQPSNQPSSQLQPALCDGESPATSATLHHRAEQLQVAFDACVTLDEWRQLSGELDALYGELADRVGAEDAQEPGEPAGAAPRRGPGG